MSYSLAYFKFKKSLEREIRNYWTIAINTEISTSWLNTQVPNAQLTTVTQNKAPYSYVDLQCIDLINYLPTVVEYARENALVNFITSFEVYMFEIMSRMIYIEPNLLDESSIKIDTKDIIKALQEPNFRYWLSNNITDKVIRNNQHAVAIEKIAKLAKCDLKPITDKIAEWNKWTYVRNCIVHTGRRVSTDLANIWPEKFHKVGSKLNIPNNELMKIQTLAMKIAKHLDNRANETVIKHEDAYILVRELFIRKGLEDISLLQRTISRNLNHKIKRAEVEKILSLQKKTSNDTTEMDFDAFFSSIIIE